MLPTRNSDFFTPTWPETVRDRQPGESALVLFQKRTYKRRSGRPYAGFFAPQRHWLNPRIYPWTCPITFALLCALDSPDFNPITQMSLNQMANQACE